jgi:hypothetical protein
MEQYTEFDINNIQIVDFMHKSFLIHNCKNRTIN